jgi:hypothetical protein
MLLQRSTTGLCHALLRFPKQTAPHAMLRFPAQRLLLHHMVQPVHKVWSKIDHKVWCHPHSTEHDTQPIAFLNSKQVVPYQTCGSTCCPGVSTPKIHSLVDLSTTCRDGSNHLHHSNHCSNYNIDPHHGQITSRWMRDHLSQRHKPNSTSQRMERLVRHSWLHD